MAKSYVDANMRRTLEKHVLSRVTRGFYLHPHDAKIGADDHIQPRVLTTLLLDTQEGVVILGDLCPRPGGRGCVWAPHYNIQWFAKPMNEDYLCEKFLQQGFHEEHARAWLEDYREQLSEDQFKWSQGTRVKFENLCEVLDPAPHVDIYDNPVSFQHFLEEQLEVEYEGQGQGYDPVDAGWLCAIQQRFVECWAARAQTS